VLTLDDVSPPANEWQAKPVIVSPRTENDLDTIDPTSLALLAMQLEQAGDEVVSREYYQKSADKVCIYVPLPLKLSNSRTVYRYIHMWVGVCVCVCSFCDCL
jgi:hypothetical protein